MTTFPVERSEAVQYPAAMLVFGIALMLGLVCLAVMMFYMVMGERGWLKVTGTVVTLALISGGGIGTSYFDYRLKSDRAAVRTEFQARVSDWLRDEYGVKATRSDARDLLAGKIVVVTVGDTTGGVVLKGVKSKHPKLLSADFKPLPEKEH